MKWYWEITWTSSARMDLNLFLMMKVCFCCIMYLLSAEIGILKSTSSIHILVPKNKINNFKQRTSPHSIFWGELTITYPEAIQGCNFSGNFLNSGNFTENVLISGNFVLYKRIWCALSRDIFRKIWLWWLAPIPGN